MLYKIKEGEEYKNGINYFVCKNPLWLRMTFFWRHYKTAVKIRFYISSTQIDANMKIHKYDPQFY